MGGCFRLHDFIAPPPLNIYHSSNHFGFTCSSATRDAANAVEKLDFEPLPACIEYHMPGTVELVWDLEPSVIKILLYLVFLVIICSNDISPDNVTWSAMISGVNGPLFTGSRQANIAHSKCHQWWCGPAKTIHLPFIRFDSSSTQCRQEREGMT